MIEIQEPPDAEEFFRQAADFLLAKEAENSLMLGLATDLGRTPAPERVPHRLWVVRYQGAVLGAAIWTPPFPVVLTGMPGEALGELLDQIQTEGLDVPGFSAPFETAEAAARYWCGLRDKRFRLSLGLILYRLRSVKTFDPPSGAPRPALPAEVGRMAEWHQALNQEAGMDDHLDSLALMAAYQGESRLWVWDDRGVSAMAGFSGFTPTGVRISAVYTPPDKRRKGYAAALTAALCQNLLARGRAQCFLFADRENETANRVYLKVGFEPVGDWAMMKFL